MKHLIPNFIQANLKQQQLHGSLSAYVMFVDLSGFTPLTQTLMAKGATGVEKLTGILNEIFMPLVRTVYARGGIIPHFAGDAFVAIFPADQDIDLFIKAALEVRDYFRHRDSSFGGFSIGLKIGLSYGEVEWGIVGRNHRTYYFRGVPIDASAVCQDKAQNKDFSIVLDKSLEQLLLERDLPVKRIDQRHAYLPNTLLATGNVVTPKVIPPLERDIALQFLPRSVVDYQQEGEFRTVISVFISFDGVHNHRVLNRFAGIVLELMNNFSGYFKEIDFGDKGGVLVGFFGAPVSFENNIDRALEFVYTLRQELQAIEEKYGLRYRIGMTIGTAYTGIIGGYERCQYAAVGNYVNLSARLMTHADWGEVLVDDEIRKNDNYVFQHRGDIKYKGIKGSVPTFKLIGRNEDQVTGFSGVLVGRNQEVATLLQYADPLLQGKSAGVAYVYGEAGIGKSRLTYELQRMLEDTDKVNWFSCQTDQILRKPFNPFIHFLRNYFEQSPEDSSDLNLEHFERTFNALLERIGKIDNEEANQLKTELLRTKSVLAALIGIVYFDSLWEQLDAKGRYENTITSIVNLFLCESLIRPVIIELEDGHWLDDNSGELLQELLRRMVDYPVGLIITSRYRDDGTKPIFFKDSILQAYQLQRVEIDLNLLKPQAVKEFAEFRLGNPITEEFFELLLRTTNSNPFYLQQLLEYFDEQGLLKMEKGAWNIRDKNIQLSSSINAILTARIDRLSALVKETVKAAAVIGREFELPVLQEVMKSNEEFARAGAQDGDHMLEEQIDVAEKGRIWSAMNDMRYIFRHSLLREAAYGMQLHTRLQQLHRQIAEAIEHLYSERIEARYVDLAFHYEQAGIFDKTCEYLRKAADYARRNYQNQQALDFYEKLLRKLNSKTDIANQIHTYLKKGKILELIGKWDQCLSAYKHALQLSKKYRDVLLLGQTHNSMGRVLLLKGTYTAAMQYLQRAEQLFESVDNKPGIADVKGNLGNLFFRQGRYERAKSYFQDSIRIGRSADGQAVAPQIVANLGLTLMNQGQYEEAIRCQMEQLEASKAIKDKQGMATIHTYLGIVYLEKGDYQNALSSFQQGLDISTELGNKQLTAVAIGNIGIVHERQGAYELAMENYEQDLSICEELGDKQGTAIALGLIGQLLNIQGEFYQAIEYLQKDLMICEELGYQKGIAKAVNTLGDIFYYLRDFERSLHFYDKAIEVTRSIGNKLVLGLSLVEKATVLLEMDQKEELKNHVQETQSIAAELGNPDLRFEARLLLARQQIKEKRQQEASQILEELLQHSTGDDQRAVIYYECFRLNEQDQQSRDAALQLYRKLYASTPKFIYKKRIEFLLGQEVEK